MTYKKAFVNRTADILPLIGRPEYEPKVKRKKIYWLSQIIGWSLIAIVNILAIILFDRFTWQRFITLLFLSLEGLVFTHILRGLIKKQNWLSLPLKKIVPRVLIASLVVGVIIYLPYLGINILTDASTLERFKAGTIPIGIVNTGSIVLLWALIYFSIHYFENYKKVEIEALIWEAAVKDFELKTLKSQLNPHFMFNAMNSIRALVDEDPKSAQTALTKLSNILRYSLKIERNEIVPLQDEMQTVEDYLSLERIRFEERLRYKINIDPKSCNIEIPPMMIQTLVENGIKHGISKIREGGEISIETKVSDSLLHIKIENTGSVNEDILKHSEGFGISNTKHRLNLLFGEQSSFSIKNEYDNKVIAELIIPIGGIK